MKLPKSFTTVTPFSKMLALSLFIILPICAFFFGKYYQQVIDEGMAQPTIVEYKIQKMSPSPTIPQNSNGLLSCKTNTDCPSSYSCVQAGPIRYNPVTKKTEPHLTCWKKGSMIPL